MSLGLTLFTLFHVALSLIGIGTGFVVIWDLLHSRRAPTLTAWFLATTVATSVTGFGFPFEKFLPSHGLAILSLVLLAAAIVALYTKHLAGPWRWIYVVGAVAAQYFNVFVLVVQTFLKVPALHELAPNQNEPPFAVTQLVVLVVFAILGTLAVRRFHPTT